MGNETKVMPSGDDVTKYVDEVVEDAETSNEDTNTAEGEAEKLLAGKYKTPEELESAYTNLSSKLGEQGSELGNLRKEAEFYKSQTENLLGKLKDVTTPHVEDRAPADMKTQIRQAREAFESGDMSEDDFYSYLIETGANKGYERAQSAFSERMQDFQAQNVQNEFLKSEDGKLFQEVRASGELNKIMAENPLEDEYSAFRTYQYRKAVAEREQAIAEAKEAGKSEAQKIAQGAEVAKTVLKSPGATVQEESAPKRLSKDSDLLDSMHATLSRLRDVT